MRAASHCRALQSCRRAQQVASLPPPRPLSLTRFCSQARRLARCSSSSCSSASAPTVSSLSRSLIRRLALQQATGERTALQLADAYLAAAEAAQPRLRAFVALTADAARRGAAAVDAARAAGAPLGPLAGVPLAVKDNLCTRGVATTAGSRILAGYVPPFDATAWARLAAAGCTLLGKTNLDEFGMGSSTESSASGPTANPWGRPPPAGAAGGGGDWAGGWVPGGSSGGSAAAVAASLCAAALGSDTGGSVRQPAAFCGVVGLKPTHGRVSRHGLVAYASSLDTVGPLAGCVEDVALLMDGLCAGGRDPLDATSRGGGGGDAGAGGGFAAALSESAAAAAPGATPSRPLAGVRVGVVAQSLAGGAGATAGVAAGLAAFAAHLESLGAAVGDASLPSFGLGLAAYYVLAPAEACSNLARYDGLRYGPAVARPTAAAAAAATRGALFGDEVKRRILTGAYVLSAGYEEAYYARAQARAGVEGG